MLQSQKDREERIQNLCSIHNTFAWNLEKFRYPNCLWKKKKDDKGWQIEEWGKRKKENRIKHLRNHLFGDKMSL